MGIAGKSLKGVPDWAKPAIIGCTPQQQRSYRKRNQTIAATPKVPMTKPTTM